MFSNLCTKGAPILFFSEYNIIRIIWYAKQSLCTSTGMDNKQVWIIFQEMAKRRTGDKLVYPAPFY